DSDNGQRERRISSLYNPKEAEKSKGTKLLKEVRNNFEAFTKYFLKKVFLNRHFQNKYVNDNIPKLQQLTPDVFVLIEEMEDSYNKLKERYKNLCVNNWESFSFTAMVYDKVRDKLYDVKIEKEPFSCTNFKRFDKNGFCYITCKTLPILKNGIDRVGSAKKTEALHQEYKLIIGIINDLLLLSDIKEYYQRQIVYLCKNIITGSSLRGILINLLKPVFNHAFPFISTIYEKMLSYREYRDCITIVTTTAVTDNANLPGERGIDVAKMITYSIILPYIYENELRFNDIETVLEYYNLLGAICMGWEQRCKELTFFEDKTNREEQSLYSFTNNISSLLGNTTSLPFMSYNKKVNVAINDFSCKENDVINEIEKGYNKDGRNFDNDWIQFTNFINTDSKNVKQVAGNFLEVVRLFLEEGVLRTWYIKPFGYFSNTLQPISGASPYIPASFSFDNISPGISYDELVKMDGYVALLLWYESVKGYFTGKEKIYSELDSFILDLINRVAVWRQSIYELLSEHVNLLVRFNDYLVENCLKNFSRGCMCISYLYKQESNEIMLLAEKLNLTDIIRKVKTLNSKVLYIKKFPLRNPFLLFLTDFHINLFNLNAILSSKIITSWLMAKSFIDSSPALDLEQAKSWLGYLATVLDDVNLLVDYLKIDRIFSWSVKCLTLTEGEFLKVYLEYIKCNIYTSLEDTITHGSTPITPYFFVKGNNPPRLLINNIFSFLKVWDKLLYSKVNQNDIDTFFANKVCSNENERSENYLFSLIKDLLALKDESSSINLQILMRTTFKTLYEIVVNYFRSSGFQPWGAKSEKYGSLPSLQLKNLGQLKKFFADLYKDLFNEELNSQSSYSIDTLKKYFAHKEGIDKMLENSKIDVVDATDGANSSQK
ncbi:MAG: hypothetical protein QXU40_02680, partial [Candidatus Pacearchaeota archaeon]